MRRRHMGGDTPDEFVAPYENTPTGDTWVAGGPSTSSSPSSGVVSLPDLKQQYQQGLMPSAFQVPSQYDVGSAYAPGTPYEKLLLNADPNVYVTPSGYKGLTAGQQNPATAFSDPGGGSVASAATSGTIIAPTIAPTATSTQSLPQTSSALSNLTSLLAQPVVASIPWLTWGWALLIALGFIVVMRKR